jgi:hypothetical protein
LATPFTRDDRRDILRATVFLWSTPFDTPRASSGCAAFSAASAAEASPDAIASSTLRRKVRMRLGLAGAFLGLFGIGHRGGPSGLSGFRLHERPKAPTGDRE